MKTIDRRFDEKTMTLLKGIVGKKFDKIRHQPFIFTNAVSQWLQLYISDEIYELSNFTEPADYFGNTEDVAIMNFEKSSTNSLSAKISTDDWIDYPIDGAIESVTVVNDNKKLYIKGEEAYNVWEPKGLIVKVSGREIAFEKPVWFDENIYITKGYDLEKNFAPAEEFEKSWDSIVTAKCERERIIIK